MSGLRAREPKIEPPKRAKILVSGDAGVGKTYFSLQFPKVYYIDIEGGAERSQYQKLLIDSGGVYVGKDEGVSDFAEVIEEIKTLATQKHAYKTLVIDSLSQLYNDCASDAELKVGSQFGANIKEANKPSRQILRWIDKLDMNVVLIAHTKSDWKNKDSQGNIGTTYDGYEKTSYHLDLWLEIAKRNCIVRKSRIPEFKEDYVFPREYKNFKELFGQEIINRNVQTITLASEETVDLAKKLMTKLNYSQKDAEKIFKTSNVESFSEMTESQINSLCRHLAKVLDAKQSKEK